MIIQKINNKGITNKLTVTRTIFGLAVSITRSHPAYNHAYQEHIVLTDDELDKLIEELNQIKVLRKR